MAIVSSRSILMNGMVNLHGVAARGARVSQTYHLKRAGQAAAETPLAIAARAESLYATKNNSQYRGDLGC